MYPFVAFFIRDNNYPVTGKKPWEITQYITASKISINIEKSVCEKNTDFKGSMIFNNNERYVR
jgi:hypothetical protein